MTASYSAGGAEDERAPLAWTGTSGPFTALAVGSRTCGLTSVGVIECIGSTQITLTAASGIFEKLMVGLVGICGIRTGGVVQCHDPLPASWVFPDGTFTDYDVTYASGGHTCGVRPDGTIACFGDNSEGQAPATRTAAAASFARVETGSNHACALRTDGRIECWGDPTAAAVTHVFPTATFSAPASVIVGQNIALALSGTRWDERLTPSSSHRFTRSRSSSLRCASRCMR